MPRYETEEADALVGKRVTTYELEDIENRGSMLHTSFERGRRITERRKHYPKLEGIYRVTYESGTYKRTVLHITEHDCTLAPYQTCFCYSINPKTRKLEKQTHKIGKCEYFIQD
jgi:hypothetical protein